MSHFSHHFPCLSCFVRNYGKQGNLATIDLINPMNPIIPMTSSKLTIDSGQSTAPPGNTSSIYHCQFALDRRLQTNTASQVNAATVEAFRECKNVGGHTSCRLTQSSALPDCWPDHNRLFLGKSIFPR